MRPDPPVRADGKCAQCGGSRQHKRVKSGPADAKGGIPLPKSVWLRHLETEPFCSRSCCETWHGTGAYRKDCKRCGESFAPADRNHHKHIYCSRKCKELAAIEARRERRKREKQAVAA